MPGGVPLACGGRFWPAWLDHALSLHPKDVAALADGIDAAPPQPTLFICISCGRGGEFQGEAGSTPDGKRLYEALQSLLVDAGAARPPVKLCPAVCFANCERGCTAAIASPGKWSYMLGDLDVEHAADILVYADAYARSTSGVVLPSGRPASLQKSIVARFPAHIGLKDAAE